MDSKLSRGRLRYLVKWKGYPERHEWTWEPLNNLTHADEAIQDFHKSHPSAPRKVHMANFEFSSLPPAQTDTPDHSTVPSWSDGKINVDDWSLNINTIPNFQPSTSKTPENPPLDSDDGWTETWKAIPIEDWNTPDPDKGPSPLPSTKKMESNHASMHWSFCRLHDCPFHRGENSWYYQ
jgi:hypothetical protein